MAATLGQMKCKLYSSAFSGEKVFQVDTMEEQSYEGVAPNHYVKSSTEPTKNGVDGQVKIRILNNNRREARIRLPDSEVLTVSADKIHKT